MSIRHALLPLALMFSFAACGGGDSDSNGDGESPTPVAAVSDEEYLRAFCTGVTEFYTAINTAPREELVRIVTEYRDSMAAVTPPADLGEFHVAFLAYLEDAVEEPTFILTRSAPEPEGDVRGRLREESKDIDECQYPTFLNGGDD